MTINKQKTNRIMQASAHGQNPFSTPDGYFSSLQTRIMDRIRQEDSTKKQREIPSIKSEATSTPSILTHTKQGRHLWVRLTAAAVFTGLFSVLGTMLYRHHLDATPITVDNGTSMSASTNIEYNDDLLDYAMLSNSDIACYLTSAE